MYYSNKTMNSDRDAVFLCCRLSSLNTLRGCVETLDKTIMQQVNRQSYSLLLSFISNLENLTFMTLEKNLSK
jgi:hypothetical protein